MSSPQRAWSRPWGAYAAAALVVAIPIVLIVATERLDSSDSRPREQRPGSVVVDDDGRGERRDRNPDRGDEKPRSERQNRRAREERSSEGDATSPVTVATPFFHVSAGISDLSRFFPTAALDTAVK
jgi:hypothetical protein